MPSPLIDCGTGGTDAGIHKGDPLVVIVDDDAAVASAVEEVLVDAAGVVHDDVVDLGVRDVASCIGAGTLRGVGYRGRASKKAIRAVAAGLSHVEGATIAANTDDNLARIHTGLGDLERVRRGSKYKVRGKGS
jgi:hypothetical protein